MIKGHEVRKLSVYRNTTPTLRVFLIFFLASSFGLSISFGRNLGAPPRFENEVVDKVIYVNGNHPQSSDKNLGVKVLPLKTINAASNIAVRNRKRGFSTKIVIYPGVYREQIKLIFQKQKDDPIIIFEAKEKGLATISGSVIWTEWKKTNSANIYVHHWPFKWGLTAYPPSWEGHVTLKPIGQRRELVFVNGLPFTQVLTRLELREGTFFVDEDHEQISISVSEGDLPSHSKIEVAVRNGVFSIGNKTNIVIKGIRFQHSVSGIEGSAVWIGNSQNVLLEDCIFIWNNWTGYRFHNLTNVTSRRNLAENNGGTGHTAWKVKNYLSQDDETSYNNWRGKAGEFFYWAVAGVKSMSIHNAVFQRHTAQGNHAAGFWFDYDNENILVENSTWCGNLKHGLFLEASQGPITIRNSQIYNNNQWGIRAIASRKITIKSNYIFNNRGQQILLTDPMKRIVTNWETGKVETIKSEFWTMNGNVVAGQIALFEVPKWKGFFSNLVSESNVWHNPSMLHTFKIGTRNFSLGDWQTETGQDERSSFNNHIANIGYQLENCTYLK